MISAHVYSAVLHGTPDRPLALTGGQITLDESNAPHVQGTLTIATPPLDLLDALDPRMSPPPRITITADAAFPWGTQQRTFDLTLRDRGVQHAGTTVRLDVASDEALLSDYAPLADDTTPLTFQDSLRDLVSYVLDTSVPGAVLAPSTDVPVPALTDSQNLIRNPRAAVNATDWAVTWSTGGMAADRYAAGGPAYSPTLWAMGATANSTGVYAYLQETAIAISPGQLYVVSVDVRAPVGQAYRLDAWEMDDPGSIVAVTSPVEGVGTGAWQRHSYRFWGVTTATKLRPRVSVPGTLLSGRFIDITGYRLSTYSGDPTDVDYYDVDTPDTADYEYSIAAGATAHAAPTIRRALRETATPDALTWDAGQNALEFLAPIVQAAGRRLVCDEHRVWTLRSEGYDAGGALEVRHAVNLVNADEKISRSDEDWFDAAVVRYTWRDRNGVQQQAVDAYALTPDYTRLRTIERATAYPGPGFAQYAVRRAQGRGREVAVTTVSDWAAVCEQGISIVLEGAPTQTGQTSRVEFDLDTDEMTIISRTIDTPPGAWVLLPLNGQEWIDSPPGASWIGEAV
jgi:hypothetical protein